MKGSFISVGTEETIEGTASIDFTPLAYPFSITKEC